MKHLIPLTLLICAIGLPGCAPPQQPSKALRLAVVVSFDQFRGDMPASLRSAFADEGFARFYREGTVYNHCYYNQANMMTGPGHAVLLTGEYPSTTGITTNDLCDRALGTCMYCAADTSGTPGSFPLLAETVGDQLIARDSMSKVIGIANKDRAAILMAGQHPTAAVWVDSETGTFTTSSSYATPSWLQTISAKHALAPYVGTTWEAELDSATAGRLDDAPWEGTFSDGSRTFPHRLASLEDAALSPVGMEMLFNAAIDVIDAEQLGADASPDVLAIGVSTTDYLGHQFGPDSREVQELFRHADRQMARLITHLDSAVGREHYVLYVTSDHGIAPVPEFLNANVRPGEPVIDAGRIDSKVIRSTAEKHLTDRFGTPADGGAWLWNLYPPSVYLREEALQQSGVDRDSAAVVVAQAVAQLPGIAISIPGSLVISDRRPETIDAETWSMIRNAYHPERSGDVLIYPKRYWVYGSRATTHGTPHDYDRWVPLMVLGPTRTPLQVADTVEPTLIAKQLRLAWGL